MRGHYQHELAHLQQRIVALGDDVGAAVRKAMWALQHREPAFARQIIVNDSLIDEQRYAIEQEALNLIALQHPLAGDLRIISAIIDLSSELERIGDYAEGIAELAIRCAALPILALPSAIPAMATEALRMLCEALRAMENRDASAATRLEAADNVVDDLYTDLVAWSLHTMRNDPAVVEQAMYYVWIAHNIERIADRTVNIGERTAFIVTGVLSSVHS